MNILEEIGKKSVRELLEKGVRMDSRELLAYRPISIQYEPVPNANGSALARIGKTQILAAIKFDIGTPYADKPDEGTMSVNAEVPAIASENFEMGPPNEDSIEFARVVDRGIRSSKIVDLKKFKLDDEHVLMMFTDLYVLDYDGNLFDTGALAAMAAIMTARLPKIEIENEKHKIIWGEYAGKLEYSDLVVDSTFSMIGDKILIDPSSHEQKGMDAGMVVSTVGENICTLQKLGREGLTKDQILQMVDIAFDKAKELKTHLKQ